MLSRSHPMPSLLASLFSDGAVVVESDVCLVDGQLAPEELAHVRNAVDLRRAQFGTGRLCSRQALAGLGLPAVPIPVGPGRMPCWPSGAVGSITHTSTYCAAVVRRSPPWRSVGVDAEEIRPLEPGMVDIIATEAERRWLDALPPEARDAHALLLFGAKEAYYKLQYPLTARFLEFHEVEIVPNLAAGTFDAHALTPTSPDLVSMGGRFAFADGKVLCGIELPYPS
jgi:4'-phosphopantetheinyl transferase EntD